VAPSKPARARLHAGLQARRGEIERAIATRIYAIADPSAAADPTYTESLRASLAAALDYGLAAVERGEERAPPVPTLLLAQARLAARNGVRLDTVLRRYLAGFTLLGDFLIQAAEECAVRGEPLQQVMRTQASLFDRLIGAITEDYAREGQGHPRSVERRRAERVRRLLDGELIDATAFEYDFAAHHLGLIATGPGVVDALRGLGVALDRRLLLVHNGEQTVWAWFGGRRRIGAEALGRVLSENWPEQASLALGEPSTGLEGWRLTHRQAAAALPVASRSPGSPARYADVALLASMRQDELLNTSLRQLYLAPLAKERDGGETFRQTLRAYIGAERNVTAAAAVLRVNRNTVSNRLRAIEQKIGRPLAACAADIDAALRLDELSEAAPR
jgi:hypothetical protein